MLAIGWVRQKCLIFSGDCSITRTQIYIYIQINDCERFWFWFSNEIPNPGSITTIHLFEEIFCNCTGSKTPSLYVQSFAFCTFKVCNWVFSIVIIYLLFSIVKLISQSGLPERDTVVSFQASWAVTSDCNTKGKQCISMGCNGLINQIFQLNLWKSNWSTQQSWRFYFMKSYKNLGDKRWFS